MAAVGHAREGGLAGKELEKPDARSQSLPSRGESSLWDPQGLQLSCWALAAGWGAAG